MVLLESTFLQVYPPILLTVHDLSYIDIQVLE
jgi:hypothetical protein